MGFLGNCRATGIGSLPHTDPTEAVEAALAAAPDLPWWPQLPQRSKREGMVEQALDGLPGLCIREGRLRHVQDEAFFLGAERVLAAYDAGDASAAAMAQESAAGLKPFLEAAAARGIRQAKGQVAGPITTGMAVLGEDGNPILYDDVLREVLAKFLALRVRWQAAQIRAAGAEPIIFVDEPFLASFGTAFFGWGKDQVQATLRAVIEGAGPTGSHCCSNTDWAMLLESPLDVVSFDAFEFAENFLVYREAIEAFLARGGTIAWGIVPTDPDALASVTGEALRERLFGLLARVEALGFSRQEVLRQSLVTPACGLGTRPMEAAARALRLTRDLAADLRRRFLTA
jgi:methionine synthase II (cobalamin-independent)